MAMKFFSKNIAAPYTRMIQSIRQIASKIPIGNKNLRDLHDEFVIRVIEDPLHEMIFGLLYNMKVFNREVIPEKGGVVIAANHTSLFDPLVSGSAIFHKSKRIAYQLTKSELQDDPFLANYVDMNGAIYIRRGESDEEAMERCHIALTEEERPLLIFPEGTINEGDNNMLPFKTGFLRIAVRAGVSVIPMATYGLDSIFGKRMKKPELKGTIRIKFGELMTLDSIFKGKNLESLARDDYSIATKEIETIVSNLYEELRNE